ncbi:MAG: glycosyl transferase family 1 [Chloroflexi bacterium GWB2_54_36]|nr:MAG: glycosyl transferase family 1 [Chloroflexi bacterium GWB2_54_36]
MRILSVLTYYRPHASGLTIYAERLAKALARRGHQVTVMTSQYTNDLPLDEMIEGVRVVRVPVAFRVSKGVVMPRFGRMATDLVRENDVIQLHLPQFDAAGVAFRGRIWEKPTIITYHCDLLMPPGLLSWAANQGILLMNELAARFAHRIVTNTRDYAEHSPFLKRYLGKLKVIPPPIELPPVTPDAAHGFAQKYNPDGRRPVIGLASRFATEKGVEVLLDALPAVLKEYPRAQVQFVGAYKNVVGEEAYFARLYPRIQEYEKAGNWKFLGFIPDADMPAFFSNLDVLALPSLNSTESFGIVQIEAMTKGVPAVASDIPGVRQPVKMHGMGKIFPAGDAAALAGCLLEILGNRQAFIREPQSIQLQYLPDTIAENYERLFLEIKDEMKAARS